MTTERFGLSCALSTPFATDGSIDTARMISHARAVLADGCDSVTLFGTTGEGFSVGVKERELVLAAFKTAGFDFRKHIAAGVLGASVEEAAAQAFQALQYNCKALLLAPPFYFKGVSDDGVVGWHSALFDVLGDACRDVILYNLPAHTGVIISHDVVKHLRRAYPKVIRGVKESSGTWDYAERMIGENNDLAILIGDERQLARAVRLGGQGAICGMANIYAERLRPMVHGGRDDPTLNALVEAVISGPVLPGIKALIADKHKDAQWLAVRAPLDPLSASMASDLSTRCSAIHGLASHISK
jgi:4-hydroxy-tetrahydrodipicolinate synthase